VDGQSASSPFLSGCCTTLFMYVVSHVTHMNESCHTYVTWLIYMWHDSMNVCGESCHTYEWVMSHIRDVTHLYVARLYLCMWWVMSHIWMSHVTHMWRDSSTRGTTLLMYVVSNVTHMSESCHTYVTWLAICGTTLSMFMVSNVTHMNESRHI